MAKPGTRAANAAVTLTIVICVLQGMLFGTLPAEAVPLPALNAGSQRRLDLTGTAQQAAKVQLDPVSLPAVPDTQGLGIAAADPALTIQKSIQDLHVAVTTGAVGVPAPARPVSTSAVAAVVSVLAAKPATQRLKQPAVSAQPIAVPAAKPVLTAAVAPLKAPAIAAMRQASIAVAAVPMTLPAEAAFPEAAAVLEVAPTLMPNAAATTAAAAAPAAAPAAVLAAAGPASAELAPSDSIEVEQAPQERILAMQQQQQGKPSNTAAAKSAGQQGQKQAAKPQLQPAAKPAPKPTAKPATQSATKSGTAAQPGSAKPMLQTAPPNGRVSTAELSQAKKQNEDQDPYLYDDYITDDGSPAAGSGAAIPAPPAPATQLSLAPLFISPPSSFDSTTDIYVDQPLLQIPQSFLGISHEWTHVEEINNIPGYKDIIRLLTSYGSGPFNIRVGGGSTDKQAYVFPQYVYDALRQVHEDTGAQYILGLNFEKGDIALSKGQLQMARDNLPPEAILSIEIGNEPNFYEGTQNNLTALQYVRCCFVPNWAEFVRQLACPCGTWDCCDYGQFAGPVWGHVNVYPTTLKWFLDVNNKFLDLTTVHWYKATKETYNTPVTLLEEAPIRKEMDNLRALVQTSQSFGIPLRVAEMNTISNSGRVGVSNVFAATLWTLDGAFEVAATGAVGVNFHQGSGQNLYTSILRWYNNGRLSPPVLRPPFYGMVLFQQAVRAGSKLLGKMQASGDGSSIKVWPLLDVNDAELRFVLINKHPSQAGTQVLRINRSWGYNTKANVTRLVARGEDPLSATSGITLGGYYYAVGGELKGADASEAVPPQMIDGMTSWKVYMPPGSAALVRVPMVNSKRKLLQLQLQK